MTDADAPDAAVDAAVDDTVPALAVHVRDVPKTYNADRRGRER